MLIVIMLLLGSLALGIFREKLDTRSIMVLVLMVVAAVMGFYFFKRFL